MDVGQRIKRNRLERGLTQKQLAEPRYTHAYISSIESGNRQPSHKALSFFAERLDMEVDELLTGRPADLPIRLSLEISQARKDASAGHYRVADKALAKAEKEAARYRMARLRSNALYARGHAAELKGNPSQALEFYEQAEEALTGESPDLLADAVAGRARCLQMLGEVHYAIYLLENLLEKLKQKRLENPTALARIHASLVAAYFEAGFYKGAGASAKEALRLAPRINDPEQLASMHMNVARVHLEEGRADRALESLQRAQDCYQQLEFQSELAEAHLARGYVFSREGKLSWARKELEAAREIFAANGASVDEARVYNELARVTRLEGDAETAERLLRASVEKLKDEKNLGVLAWAHRELGILLTGDRPDEAAEHLLEARRLFEKMGDSNELAATLKAHGDLLAERDVNAACSAYRSGIEALIGA